MANSRPAVLFDIDGTLVDSNYLHVHAWQRAFAEVGLPVQAWHIHRSIGMDGSILVDELSRGAPGDVQKRLKDLHTRYYQAGAALLTERWWTLVAICVVYLAILPVGVAMYWRIKRQRAARPSGDQPAA